ncbi:MAG: MBL fold metallo-hydrolase [Bacillota bacterium]
MDITFINVGYGDSILLRAGGCRLLIDGGTANPAEFTGSRIESYAWLSENGVTRLDAVIVSHIHDDHVSGLEKIIDRLDVKELWLPYPADIFENGREARTLPGAPNNMLLFTRAFNCISRIVQSAKRKGITLRELNAANGGRIAVGPDLSVEVLGPEPARRAEFMGLLRQAYHAATDEEAAPLLATLDRLSNDASLLLRISDSEGSALFPGDGCPPAWRHLLASGALKSDIWKIPHHGQIDSVTEEAIRGISPRAVVTTSSSDRRYNSSNPEVYRAIRETLGTDVQFVFSDEYSYPPYFAGMEGLRAVRVTLAGGIPHVVFE